MFGVSVEVAFESLRLVVKHVAGGMPHELKDYLQKTMKRFFVYHIWENGQGYKILC